MNTRSWFQQFLLPGLAFTAVVIGVWRVVGRHCLGITEVARTSPQSVLR